MAVEGTVRDVDRQRGLVTLDGGIMLVLGASRVPSLLQDGARVIATYEEQDGKMVATSLIVVR